MGVYKPTEDLLLKAGRVKQFWHRFVTGFQDETALRNSAEKPLSSIFQNRTLKVHKSRRDRW